MRFLIIDFNKLHHKNRRGLLDMFQYIQKHINHNMKFVIGNLSNIRENFDVIYSPCSPINTSLYPNKKFIFGPHFSVFPNKLLDSIKNIHNNCIYLQPSKWAADTWINLNAEYCLPIRVLSFPVDINRFKPNNKNERTNVFVYYKRRKPEELSFITQYLKANKINFKVFDYVQGYNENEYIHYLQNSKYGIVVDAHESQGFAIQEALSCNVPLLVWNVTSMKQEHMSNYSFIPATTIPYWDERCGEVFYDAKNFKETYEKFTSNLEKYTPRDFIIEHISSEPCSERFNAIITSLSNSHLLETK